MVLGLWLAPASPPALAAGAGDAQRASEREEAGSEVALKVRAPFLELHTGAGAGYPVFHVLERGEAVELLGRRTDWILVKGEGAAQGWAPRQAVSEALSNDREVVSITGSSFADYRDRRWEAGVYHGELSTGAATDAPLVSVYAGLQGTRNIGLELTATQVLGDFSDSRVVSAAVTHQPFPDWRLAPFFTLGAARFDTEAQTVSARDERREGASFVGGGLRYYVTGRLFLRMDYRRYVIFTDRNENQEARAWKIGLGTYF